jgi:hypothetical protein
MSASVTAPHGPKDSLRLAWAHLPFVPLHTLPAGALQDEFRTLRGTIAPTPETDYVAQIKAMSDEEAGRALHGLHNFLVKVCPPE